MKQLPIISLLVLAPIVMHAQMDVFSLDQERATAVDTARYEVTYTLNYTWHPDIQNRFDDVRSVLIGNDKVKDFSDILCHYDSLKTADLKRGADSFYNPKGTPQPYEVLLSPKTRTADMKYRLPSGIGVLHYTDTVPTIKWTFTPDTTRTILGYECQQATCDFGGRHYSAWFTTELPLPYGPYKLGGLPGLILQIQDDEGQYVWNAIGFERSDKPIFVYDYEGEKRCSPKEAAKAISRCFKTPIAFQLSAFGGGKGRVMLVGKDGKVRDATEVEDNPIPYKPIEL